MAAGRSTKFKQPLRCAPKPLSFDASSFAAPRLRLFFVFKKADDF
jgi:hypothetical protein